jgi:hypothetical protein
MYHWDEPLAASLLYFAWRFEWHAMALFGLFATWITCISRGDANAPLGVTTALFIMYWLLFESFDILRAHRGAQAACLTWIFPVNTVAFLALAYRSWHTSDPADMWRMAALSAVLFLLSSVLRIAFRAPDVETPSQDPFDRIRKGTYEAPLGIAVVLAGLAILGRVTGFWTNVALAFEAEILYLAGIRFRSRFLRTLGRGGFTASLFDIWATASDDSRMITVLGAPIHNWVPSLAVHVILFYLNRFVWRATTVFSFAASALVALIIYSELGPHTAPMGLFVFALLLFEFALRKSLRDIRIQSYLAASAAAVLGLWAGGFTPHGPALIWMSSAMSALASWLFTGRILSLQPDRLSPREAARVRDLFAVAGSGFALLTLWILLPGPLTTAAWTALALAVIALASALNLSSFRWLAAGILGMAYARLLGINLTSSWAAQNAAEHCLIPLFVMGVLYFAWDTFRRIPDPREQWFAPVFTWFALVPALWFLVLETNRFYVASAWATVTVALLLAGLQMRLGAFRSQSYCVAAMSVISCILINLSESGRAGMPSRILGSSLVIALLFAGEFLLPRDAVTLGSHEKHARSCFSIAATLLLIFVLDHEVSGGLLTVAWGLQALACLGIGFPARERMLRLQGLAVFALCILKLFLYDLRNLETIYRILSFTALGIILLGVSWIYTRFRTQIRRYL